ncbi:hypothetical protein FV228_12955 [Methylobacterium sp. WL18]|uniref:hypothetical protein n=1 Tax=Methylobacterium sp. WL18 TaxID=2603897 RepID=UPI0011CADE3E|nr:hypothetical protein [Methylobacterium sp. WL18]TXN69155.1 hypothetical protein FV228_12955 [Methylobacterium sp. WL18]
MAERKFKKPPKVVVVDLAKPVPAEIFMREMCRKSHLTMEAQVGLTIQEQTDYIAREIAAHEFVFAIHQAPHSPILKWIKGRDAADAKGGLGAIPPAKGTAFFMPNEGLAEAFLLLHGKGLIADMIRADDRRDAGGILSSITPDLFTRSVIEHFHGPQTGPVTDPV